MNPDELDAWSQLASFVSASDGFHVNFIIEKLCNCALADDEVGLATWSTLFHRMLETPSHLLN